MGETREKGWFRFAGIIFLVLYSLIISQVIYGGLGDFAIAKLYEERQMANPYSGGFMKELYEASRMKMPLLVVFLRGIPFVVMNAGAAALLLYGKVMFGEKHAFRAISWLLFLAVVYLNIQVLWSLFMALAQ